MSAGVNTASAALRDQAISSAFAGSLLQRLLVFLCAIKIVGLILVFDPAGLQAFDLPKAVFSHTLAWFLAAALITAFARYGRQILPATHLHLAVVGFVLANIAASIVAENRYIAVFGDQDRYLGLAFVADMAVLYFAVAASFVSSRDYVSVLASVTVAGALALAYGVAQTLGLDPVPWLRDRHVQPFATFGHADMFAHFLSSTFGLGLGLAVATAGNRRLRLVGLGGLFAALVSAAAVSVVAERGALLGIGAALVAGGVVAVHQQGRRAVMRRGVAVTSVVAAAGLGAMLLFTPLGSRTMHLADDAGSGRLVLYDVGLRATLARPLLGYGPDNFGVVFPAFQRPPPHASTHPQTSAHDWLLQASVTTGLVGVTALIVLLVSFASSLWRVALVLSPMAAIPILLTMVAYWSHGLVAVGSVSIDWMPWLLFGAIAACVGERRIAEARRLSPQVALGLKVAAVGLTLLVLTGVLLPMDALRANRDANIARAAWTAESTATAIGAAASAVGRDAGRADYWNWLGLARYQAGMWQRAAQAYEEAARRAPHEAAYWDNLALAREQQAVSGDNAEAAGRAAVGAAARAVEADPFAPRVNQILCDIAFRFGDFDLSLLGAARTTAYYDVTYGHRAFLAAQRATDLPRARRILEDALAVRETAALRSAFAAVALRMGDRETARANALRALELAFDDPDARAVLDQLER